LTEAEVRNVIDQAATRGIRVSEHEASVFLRARELYASDPTNDRARRVLERYTKLLTTGTKSESFEDFMIGPLDTEQELAGTAHP